MTDYYDEVTYKEGIHEFNLNLRAVRRQPERVDHASAVEVKHPRAQQVEQDCWKQWNSMPPTENYKQKKS